MPDSKPLELIQAEKLNNKGKVNEALHIVKDLVDRGDLNPENNLECKILKGILYNRLAQYSDAIKIGEQAFEESKRLGKNFQSIDALFIKSLAFNMLVKHYDAKENLDQAKKILKSLTSESPEELESRRAIISYSEGWFFSMTGDIDKALKLIENGLEIIEDIEKSERWAHFGTWLIIGIIIICTHLGRFEEAFPYFAKFEEKIGYSPMEIYAYTQFKGDLLSYLGEYQEALKFSERCLKWSQNVLTKNNALITKSRSLIGLARWDEAEELHTRIEGLVELQKDIQDFIIQRWRAQISLNRSFIFFEKGEFEQALEHAMKSMHYFENLNLMEVYMGLSLFQIARIFLAKGDLDYALEYANRCMTIRQTPSYFKTLNFAYNLGVIYELKGELDRALEYFEQALALSKKINLKGETSSIMHLIGEVYWRKGEIQRAINYLEGSLILSEETEIIRDKTFAIFWLININIDIGSLDKAREYLNKLEQISDSYEFKIIKQLYKIAKALILKTSTRARNRVEAEELLKEVAEEEVTQHKFTVISLINLTVLLLEELEKSNELEILDEINPLITRLIKIAEDQNSFSLLAETKLLQGRLALLKLNLDDARQFLTQAQEIASEHGLQLLAKKISNEHDSLLEELETWKSFKRTQTSLPKRLEISSLDSVLDRMLGKRSIESTELSPEEPILLLIVTEGGIPVFSNSFTKELSVEDDIISSFLTTFNTFSEEVFSKGLDRAKFGDYMLVMDIIGPFSLCYLFKGQSYLAKQKLIHFAHRVQNTTSIWEAFKSFYKTSQVLELKDN
ncbi:MAG: tetratricopeptide repeat protein, partial [Promethearchaeota archaeon]